MVRCPECQNLITIMDYITDKIADCSKCGATFDVEKVVANPQRDISASPAPQRRTKKF